MPKPVGVAITPRTASRLSQTINKKELTPTNSKRPPFVPPVYNDLTVFVNKTGATLQRGYIIYADGRDTLGRQQAKKFDAAAIAKSHCQWVVVTEKGRTIPADGEFLASRFSQRPGIISKSGTSATGATIGAQAGSFVGLVGNPGFSITSATGFDMTSSEVEAGFFSSIKYVFPFPLHYTNWTFTTPPDGVDQYGAWYNMSSPFSFFPNTTYLMASDGIAYEAIASSTSSQAIVTYAIEFGNSSGVAVASWSGSLSGNNASSYGYALKVSSYDISDMFAVKCRAIINAYYAASVRIYSTAGSPYVVKI